MGKAVGGGNTAQLCASDLASTLPVPVGLWWVKRRKAVYSKSSL